MNNTHMNHVQIRAPRHRMANKQKETREHLLALLAMVATTVLIINSLQLVHCHSLSAALSSLANQSARRHYDSSPSVTLQELITQAQTDRTLERNLINMLMQHVYNNDDLVDGSLQDVRALAINEPNQIIGYEPTKRSYWKQCAVNAVSCFGRRKRR